MKKIFVAIILILIFSPIPLSNQDGVYNTFSHTLICKNKDACYHEVAHKLDQESEWVSHTEEFQYALRVYLYYEIKQENPDAVAIDIIKGTFSTSNKLFSLSDPSAEAYATIFEYANGKEENMPEIFHKFYDWDMADTLIARYVGE